MSRQTVVGFLAGVLLFATAPASWGMEPVVPEQRRFRRYEQGPLQGDEFRGTRPTSDPTPLGFPAIAYTATECRYTYQFQFETVRETSVVARLTEIEFFAVFVPESSWNIVKSDWRLLEHEQGHFDITHSMALAAQAAFAKQQREGKQVTARGRTREAAAQSLDETLKKLIGPIFLELPDLHRQYDTETKHGTDRTVQAEHRRRQRERIRQLHEELDNLRP